MSLCHLDHFPYSCDDESLHQQPHHHHHHHHHSWCNSWFHSSCLTGQVSITKENGFQLQIDVHHFKYDELTVKAMGEWIIVLGKQSNENDEPVCITKQFSRKYKLPKNYDSNLVTSSLSSDGILLVKVPPPAKEPEVKEKIIEIQKTGSFFNSSGTSNNKEENGTGSKKTSNTIKEDKNKDENGKTAKKDTVDKKKTSIQPPAADVPGPSGINANEKIEEVNANDSNISTQQNNDDNMNNDSDNV